MKNRNYLTEKYRAWRMAMMMVAFFCCALFSAPGVRAEEMETVLLDMTEASGALLPPAQEQLIMPISADAGWSHRSQLTESERVYYDALAKETDWQSITKKKPVEVQVNISRSNQAALQLQLARATHAFVKDYSEYYWIDYFAMNIHYSNDNRFITQVDLYPLDYYTDIRNEFSAVAAELQKAYGAVGGATQYELVESIHSYVCRLITYADFNLENPPYHTITGGLLDKYNHIGVCECYAKLFRLLCEKNNIPCILVSGGEMRNGLVYDNHMWNYVEMDDGKWYLVDPTWDDQSNIVETYFLVGSENVGFYGTKVADDHVPVGRYGSAQYVPFEVPPLQPNSYLENNPDVREAVKPTGISLSGTSLSLEPGGQADLVASLSPAGASVHGLVWSSSNRNVATVEQKGDRATVKAIAPGTATITVRDLSSSSVSASCTVRVNAPYVPPQESPKVQPDSPTNPTNPSVSKATVRLNASSIRLQLKKSTSALKASGMLPGDRVASWTTSNKKVATVSSKGKITAKKTGTATITVKTRMGAVAKCKVTVQKGAVKTTKLQLSQTSATLRRGKSLKISLTRLPITANDKVTYKTSNKKVATVSSKGKITAKKKGTATITVKAGKKQAKIKIVVK